MDLEDILEVIGRIFAIIGLVVLLAYCFLGWIFAFVAFFHGKVVLGIALLVIWVIVSGARLSW